MKEIIKLKGEYNTYIYTTYNIYNMEKSTKPKVGSFEKIHKIDNFMQTKTKWEKTQDTKITILVNVGTLLLILHIT